MDERPQPGDTVVITVLHDRDFEKEFTVIECPVEHRGGSLDRESTVWVGDRDMCCAWHIGNTRLINRKGTTEGARNFESVEESLSRQRDDNLRRVFE